MVKLTINGKEVEVPEGTTILQAARKLGIDIPTLCTLEPLHSIAVCRLCLVEVKGARALMPACATPVSEGMEVKTNTERVLSAIRQNLEFIASEHDFDCQNCPRNGNCELQILAYRFNLDRISVPRHIRNLEPDTTSPAITMNFNRCVLCARCIRTCSEIQTVYALDYAFRGYDTIVTTPFNVGLGNSTCVSCGLCTLNCPVGALTEKQEENEFLKKVLDGEKFNLLFDEAALLALPEEFWYAPGSKIASEEEFKALGISQPISLSFYSGLSIVFEAKKILEDLNGNSRKTIISSACPAATEFLEKFFPEFRSNLVSFPSSVELALKGLERGKQIVFTQCIAKKKLVRKLDLKIDNVLTVREMARAMKSNGKTPDSFSVEDVSFKHPEILDYVSGGRTELVIRTIHSLIGKEVDESIFTPLRNVNDNLKQITIDVDGKQIKFVSVSTLGEFRKVLEKMKNGETFDFIEARACPGGCIGGGGMPIPTNDIKRTRRAEGIYQAFENLKFKDPWKSMTTRLAYQKLVEKVGAR